MTPSTFSVRGAEESSLVDTTGRIMNAGDLRVRTLRNDKKNKFGNGEELVS